MRIVFINRYFYPDLSATSQMLQDLSIELAKHGYDVHVMCSRQLYDAPSADLPARDVVRHVQVHRVWTTRFGRDSLLGRAADYLSFHVSCLISLPRWVRRGDMVVAKTDPPLISVVAAAVARLRGARLINWLQDVFPEVAAHLETRALPNWLHSLLLRARNASLRSAVQNVVLGERMRQHLIKAGIEENCITVIENWADGVAIVPHEHAGNGFRTRQQWQNKWVVAYSGNLGRAHDYETMLGAAQKLRDKREIVFAIIGGGQKMQRMRSECERHQLKNVVFLPYQPREELSESLCAADVHLATLLPELEGLIVPSKFYGILAAGRPVIFIGDRDGELARAIANAQCGDTIECGDAEGLKQAILRLCEDRDLALNQGRRARAAFDRQFSLASATSKWLALLAMFDLTPASWPAGESVPSACKR